MALNSYELNTEYIYHAVPKLNDGAFLLAKISNWGQYNLLAGDANIFFEGAFVGNSFINSNVTADTLLISMGRDNNININRLAVKEYASSKLIGMNKEVSFGYEISVFNKKSVPIDIEILDQIPVSQNNLIEVTLDEKGSAKYVSENGKLLWTHTIKPGQSSIEKFAYTVKYPKKESVTGIK
jgi:uncharacterized protein (TIGR02231 family)